MTQEHSSPPCQIVVAPERPPAGVDSASGGEQRHADFSRAVLEDLYRYPRKRSDIAFWLWGLLGIAGGHRFYLDRPGTAVGMLFTGGGGLAWWLVDLFLIRDMVASFNADQTQRQQQGLPPRALYFMPPLRDAHLPPYPAWVLQRAGSRRLLGDLMVLAVAGFTVGNLAATTGNYEPIVVILALGAITLLGARWDALATIPMLSGFDRWSHRLRLFYYTNDPGGPLRLFFRPLYGLISAPFRRQARAEAWLYLQLGGWFTIIFTGIDLIQAISIGADGVRFNPEELLLDLAFTFISIYAFAAPIGAILTTHVLLQKRDRIVWLLTGVTLAATVWGVVVNF